MKKKISISIDEETLRQIDLKLEGNVFRNKSHLIELGVQKFLREISGNRIQEEKK